MTKTTKTVAEHGIVTGAVGYRAVVDDETGKAEVRPLRVLRVQGERAKVQSAVLGDRWMTKQEAVAYLHPTPVAAVAALRGYHERSLARLKAEMAEHEAELAALKALE